MIYLPRTDGISSSDVRNRRNTIRLGIVGYSSYVNKIACEASYVNGIDVEGLWSSEDFAAPVKNTKFKHIFHTYEDMLISVDAVYIHEYPRMHYKLIKKALLKGKHVICTAPVAMSDAEYNELASLADAKHCVLMDAIKTAYSTAYQRLLRLLQSGNIGEIISVQTTCTSLSELSAEKIKRWGSLNEWGPIALLPVFQILGTEYRNISYTTRLGSNDAGDSFTNINLLYDHATAHIMVGSGVKSEGEMIISGTKGYVYVPAPWWKMDYFELRFEGQNVIDPFRCPKTDLTDCPETGILPVPG